MKYISENSDDFNLEEDKAYLTKRNSDIFLRYNHNNDEIIELKLKDLVNQVTNHIPISTDVSSYCGCSTTEDFAETLDFVKSGVRINDTEETAYDTVKGCNVLWIALNDCHEILYYNNANEHPERFDLSLGVGLYDRNGWFMDSEGELLNSVRISSTHVLYFYKFWTIPNATMRVKIKHK